MFLRDRCLVNKQNYNKIKKDMHVEEVLNVLGKPSSYDGGPADANNLFIIHYCWRRFYLIDRYPETKNTVIMIDFKDGKVINKRFEEND